jgi:hypothetical protein
MHRIMSPTTRSNAQIATVIFGMRLDQF